MLTGDILLYKILNYEIYSLHLQNVFLTYMEYFSFHLWTILTTLTEYILYIYGIYSLHLWNIFSLINPAIGLTIRSFTYTDLHKVLLTFQVKYFLH